MPFSKRKSELLCRKKELKASTFLFALLTAAALFVPYIISSNGYFIFYGDFNVQQIPFYKMCHAAIRSGNVKWSFTTDLGANFVGSYAFYLLGSPFFWLTIPFPNSFVPHLMGPLLILKFALAALTAYLYIRRFTRTPEAARLGGLLYAFSGFSVYNIFFNHFHEAIIVFPLLLLAMEYLITENRRGYFALAVALCAVTNYFFFYGMVVFCLIYYFVRLASKDIKFKLSRFLWIAFESVLGVLMAAVLLLPAVLGVLGNERLTHILLGWHGIMYSREQIYLNIIECFFFPPDLPARPVFFPQAEVKWASLGGWLPLFGMTGVISWFAARKKTWIKRMIIICAFMALVPILNSAFYAFNGSYFARWFYMPILIMCLASSRVTEEEIDLKPGIKWTAAITLAFTLVIGLFPQKNEEGKITLGLFTENETLNYKLRFWLTASVAIGSIIVLAVLYKLLKKNTKRFIVVSTVFVLIVSAGYGNFFIALGRMHSYDIKSVIIDTLIEGDLKLDGDKDSYRIDTYECVDNTGMYLGYSTINAFHSVVPGSVMQFYKFVGVERDVASRPETSNPALRPLLSVKYLIDRDSDSSDFKDENGKTKMPGYKYIKQENGFLVYENENYIGYGFSPDYYVTEEFLKPYSGSQKARMMLKAVVLTEEQVAKYSDILSDANTIRERHAEDVLKSQSVNGDNLGLETEGEIITSAENSGDEITLGLTDSDLAKDAARLNQTSAKYFKTDNNGFEAVVNRDKKSLVVFSIPYDSGWKATVNGKAAEIEKVDIGLMAVAVPKGESNIRFDYETPGLYIGLITTAAAFAIFLVYFIVGNRIVSKKKCEEEYPEGERLLREWKQYEAANGEIEFEDDISEDSAKDTEKETPKKPPEKTENTGFLDGLSLTPGNSYTKSDDVSGGFTVDQSLYKD